MKKNYWEMNTDELREATKEFNQEFIADKSRSLNSKDRKALGRANRRGRPTIGKGSKKINITIEGGLFTRADKLAKREGVNRSQIVARGILELLKRKDSLKRKAG